MHLVGFFLILLASCSTSEVAKNTSSTDFHMHIHSPGEILDDMQYTGNRALFAADSVEIHRALVLSNAYSKNATRDYAQKENDFIINEVAKYPSRLAGACAINPKMNWSAAEIKRCHEKGIKVLKLHLMASGLNLTSAIDYDIAVTTIKNAELYKMTILIHANYPTKFVPGQIEKLKQLIESFPQTRWIIGHLFGREFNNLLNLKHSNFFVETSVLPIWLKTSEERQELVDVMRKVGIKHFVFGSDWPVIHPAETLKALKELPLSHQELLSIHSLNANQLNDLFK